MVAVYSGKPDTEPEKSRVVAESGPKWREEDSDMGLTSPEVALIKAIRFLGVDYSKDLYYKVMSRARKTIQEKNLSKGELEGLNEVLKILGMAAIE